MTVPESQQRTRGPMDGVRVLDLTQIYAGPYCTFLMAMAGAEVIKIEPPGGEHLRKRDARSGAGVPFAMLNANKLSVTLNLKNGRGRDLFFELLRSADVVVENFAPGVMDRLGFDYESLCEANPQIILASGSGYGQDGPYRSYPAMDLTVQAMSGVMSATGFPEMPPVKSGPALCDFSAGVHLFGAVASALFDRERNGRGSHIDVALLDATYPMLASNIGSLYSARGDLPERTGNRHGGLSLCPYNVYPTSDGFLAIICNNEKHWQSLVQAMGSEGPATSTRYSTMRERVEKMDEVDALVGAWTSLHTRDEVYALLLEHRVPTAPVRSLREVLADRHMHERGMLLEILHPEHGLITCCRSPLNFVGREQPPYQASPSCGADTARILASVGVGSEELAVLRRTGAI